MCLAGSGGAIYGFPPRQKNGLRAEDITLVWDADGQMVHLKDFPTIAVGKPKVIPSRTKFISWR